MIIWVGKHLNPGGLVSRGLGHVTLMLRSILVDGPAEVFSTTELCMSVYGSRVRVQKKHRVAVLRGLQTLVDRGAVPIWRFNPMYEKADAGWFNPTLVGKPKHSTPLQPKKRRRGDTDTTSR
jgi:hypothetical protein